MQYKSTKMYLKLVLLVILTTFLPSEVIAQGNVETGTWKGEEIRYRPGEIAVKLEKNASPQQMTPLLQKYDAEVKRQFDKLRWGVIELPKGTDIFPVIKKIKKEPIVAVAEPSIVTELEGEPDDPQYQNGRQWGLKNTGQCPPCGSSDADIDAELAWTLTTGSSDVVIAVTDSGIPMEDSNGDGTWDESDLSHPDLDETTKVILGSDYVNDGEGVQDSSSHGTSVAGIAGAETNNSEGIAGVCWSCKLLVIQVADKNGHVDIPDFEAGVREAVDYAKNNDVNLVINASVGWKDPDPCLKDAVDYAEKNGVLMAAASGNDTVYPDSLLPVEYPAAYSDTDPNVVAVGATDHNDERANYSKGGPELNVVAPGGAGLPLDGDDIFTTYPSYLTISDTSYQYGRGTSMATPHVAGTAALVLTAEPFLTPGEVRDVLENTADDINLEGFDEETGHGRINAWRAVGTGHPAAPTNLVITNAGEVGAHPKLDWDDNTEPDLDHYNVYRCTSYYTSCSWSKIAETTTSDYTDTFVIIKDKEDADHRYDYYVSAVDGAGLESEASNTVSTWGTQPLLRGPEEEDENPTPDAFALHAPVPNPVETQTTVQVDVPETRSVTVTVYDVMGRQVAQMAHRTMTPGFHHLSVQPDRWPSGVYFVRMTAGPFTATRRLTVVR